MTGEAPVRRLVVPIAGVLILTAVAYRGVVNGGFVYDDQVTVVKNPAVRSLSRAPEWVLSPYAVSANRGGTNFRPVTVASYAADYALWGEHAAGFHATNLVVHLAVVALVYLLALRLWEGPWPATAAAAWMALHPMNAEAVNYISARSSTLAAAGLLAAVALYDRWARRGVGDGAVARGPWWLVGALAAGLLALGAKESAAVLPLLIVVWDRARFGRLSTWVATARRSAPFWALLVAWLAVRRLVVGPGLGADEMPAAWLVQWFGFAAEIVNTAVIHTVWPARLAVDYGWPIRLETTAVIAALAGAAGLAGAGFVASRWDRRIGWCAAWFAVALLPVLALPAITRIALYQEHRAYLAQIGAAWFIGGVVCLLAPVVGRPPRARLAALLLAAGLVAAAAWVDGERTWVWGDKVRLWEDALAKYPDSAVARNERGRWLLESGRIDDAEREFLAALRTMPNYVYTYLMLGMTYDKRGDAARAVAAYRTALEFRPAFVEARIRLGLAYEVLGRVDEALAEYDRAIRDDPWASPALMFSAAIMADRGRLDEALRRLRRVAPDDPIYQDAQHAITRLTSDGSSLAPLSRRRVS